MGFLSRENVLSLGFQSVGQDVYISDKASFYGTDSICIGNNVRIDDFCIISGNVIIGSNVHISAYSALYGRNGIILSDYSGVSARVTIYSAMDDFSGDYLIGPVHDTSKTRVFGEKVILGRYTQVGAHSVIFPGVVIGEGSVVGAMSLVKESLLPWGIYAGIPSHLIRNRKKGLLKLL